MVERRAISHSSAPVVPDDGKSVMAEPRHHLHKERRHVALAHPALGGIASAVAREIRRDDRERRSQNGSDVAPHDARLRKTMQEDDRRPAARAANEDRSAVRVHALFDEAFNAMWEFSH
jgi:hypothetical protein